MNLIQFHTGYDYTTLIWKPLQSSASTQSAAINQNSRALIKITMKNISVRVGCGSRYDRIYSRSIGTVSDNLDFEMNVKVQAKDFNQIDKIVRDWKLSVWSPCSSMSFW
jgi:hypothetical protein